MATLSLKIKTTLDGVFSDTGAVSGVNPTMAVAFQNLVTLTNGTGTNQGNELFQDSQSLASTNKAYDWDAGTLENDFGDAIVFTTIKALLLVNKASTSNFDLTLTGDWLETTVLSGTTPAVIVPPKGVFLVVDPGAGFVVTATTADVFDVSSGSNTVAYDLFVVGVT